MFLNLGDLPPPTARLVSIPGGPAGVRATLKLMARLTRKGKSTLPVRMAAQQITQHLRQRDSAGEVNALHEFVRDRIRFVRDVRGLETLQDPERTLQLKSGDCDDKSTLLAALLEAIGFRTRFRAVAFRPGVFSHVFPEVQLGKRWIPLEVTACWPAGRAPQFVASMLEHV